MTRFIDHEKAVALRKQEMSYSQIKNILNISKSTLSGWLKQYPLTKKRISELKDKNEARIEKFRETMRKKRNDRLTTIYQEQKNIIFPITKRELYLCGLFLYWGEGTKSHDAELRITNTDPSMIKFFIYWLEECLKVPKKEMTVYLHLYKDMNINNEISYWSTILNIPTKQFAKPYIKNNSSININHKGSFGHGTCNLKVGSARLSERILMSLKVITDKYGKMRS